jgi:hypothetical protein
MIAFVHSDFLVSPGGERVGAGPEQTDSHGVQDGLELCELSAEIIAGFTYGAADFCVDLDVALHKFRFDGVVEVFRECGQNLINTASQRELT